MAIIIPSKHIYEPPQNAKVRDNLIDKIEIEATNVKPDNDYNVTVYNEKVEKKHDTLPAIDDIHSTSSPSGLQYDVAYVKVIPQQTTVNISVPKKVKNGYINKLLTGVNKDGIPDIKFSLYGNIAKGNATGVSNVGGKPTNITYTTTETYAQGYSLPEVVTETYRGNMASVNIPIYGNLTNITVTETGTHYNLQVKITSGAEITKLSGGGSMNNTLTGNFERYTAIYIDITIYGNTIGISLEDKIVTVGDINGRKPDSFESNELLQDSNYIKENSENKNAIVKMFTDTLNHYANGKETAELLCSISEYYEENGNLAISTESNNLPMIFHQYDKVIPMIMNANRQDEPMSKNKNGTAKVFQVLSTEIYYDGAVWQKLFLQEA